MLRCLIFWSLIKIIKGDTCEVLDLPRRFNIYKANKCVLQWLAKKWNFSDIYICSQWGVVLNMPVSDVCVVVLLSRNWFTFLYFNSTEHKNELHINFDSVSYAFLDRYPFLCERVHISRKTLHRFCSTYASCVLGIRSNRVFDIVV